MDLSPNKTKEARSLKCTVNELVFADLLSIGYTEQDAYILAYPADAALSLRMQKTNMENITRRGKFKALCEQVRKKNASTLSVPSEAGGVELIGAEDVAKEILMSAKTQPVGSKERADLMAKYNDIRKDNEQVTEDVTEAIHFYLPVKCHQCPLFTAYNVYLSGRGEAEVRPVEMEGIIRHGDRIVKKIKKDTAPPVQEP